MSTGSRHFREKDCKRAFESSAALFPKIRVRSVCTKHNYRREECSDKKRGSFTLEIVFIRLDLNRDVLITFLQDDVHQFTHFTTVVTSINIQHIRLNIFSISLSAF